MKLSAAITAHIAHKRFLGMRFLAEQSRLKSFVRSVGDIELDRITPDATWAYLVGRGLMNFHGYNKFAMLKSFYRFVLARGYASSSPLPKTIPKLSSTFIPYIYTQEELRRLFAATETLDRWWDPLRVVTFRTLLILLYGAGLRIGEALRLTVADVNLTDGLLTIRDSKFYKTRLVPVTPQLADVLRAYFRRRRLWHRPIRGNSSFFATSKKAAVSTSQAEVIFGELRIHAGLYHPERGRPQPRLHDLRHTSAVHRLIAWYRNGKDVQTLLPYLATYLGHRDLSGTQCYLSMTPELLDEVNRRFEGYALSEVNHV